MPGRWSRVWDTRELLAQLHQAQAQERQADDARKSEKNAE